MESTTYLFFRPILIYGAGNQSGCRCGFIMVAQPSIGSIRLGPGFSWNDLTENWKRELESDEIVSDAKLLALGISLLVGFHDRLA